MKKINFIIVALFFSLITMQTYSQDVKDSNTKMENFASKTGTIVKFYDYSLSNLPLTYGAAESRIRKFISGGEVGYFYQISYTGKYKTITASIAYEDLLEVIKAIDILNKDSEIDANSSCDYLENKFVTDDGFKLGYYCSKGKIKWYIVLDKYSSDNTVFINDVSTIKSSFESAKIKIEELKVN